MNANELADKLEDALDTDSWCQECGLETTEPVARQAATMLRQQQSEIEALKRQVGILKQNVENWMDNAGQHPDEEYWKRILK